MDFQEHVIWKYDTNDPLIDAEEVVHQSSSPEPDETSESLDGHSHDELDDSLNIVQSLSFLEDALRVEVSSSSDTTNRTQSDGKRSRTGKKRKYSEPAGPPPQRSWRPKKCMPGCALSEDPQHFMVGCDGCKKWYHGSCVNLTKKQADIISKYFCEKCIPQHGPSQKKAPTNRHRRDYFDPFAEGKPVETGTAQFIENLKARDASFAQLTDAVETKLGREIDMEYMQKTGFKKLILIEERSGLDLVIPDRPFSYADVVRILGDDKTVSAIDVESQEENVIVTLRQYLTYMQTQPPRETVINVISLEFSTSPMSPLIEPPRIVKELSWVDNYFKGDGSDIPPESPYAKPEVQKYCLMSAEHSYTDFHIDFGGTSVWYHIFKGTKIFYLIEPTEKNLNLYESWMKAKDQSTRFLGDETECYRLELKEGNTVLMPSGWIHAVYTPVDSLVFGGNFLHHLAVDCQFKINKMEDRMGTPERYRFPHFYTVCWSAFDELLGKMEELVEENSKKKLPSWLLKATGTLYNTLKDESPEAVSPEELKRRKDEMKEDIDYKHLLRKADGLLKKSASKHAKSVGAPSPL